jgi:pyruvate carboxylase subunit B
MRLLTGKAKIDIPLKKKETTPPPAAAAVPAASPTLSGPVTSQVAVQEDGRTRTFTVTVEPMADAGAPAAVAAKPIAAGGTPVYSTFAGSVEIVDMLVKVGDTVQQGGVVAQIEAMKAQHDIKSPVAGSVTAVHVAIGDEIDSSRPIVTIA